MATRSCGRGRIEGDCGGARPGSGGGAFLLEAASRTRSALDGSATGRLFWRSWGAFPVWRLIATGQLFRQVALYIFLSDLIERSGRPAPNFVEVCYTLDVTPSPKFDLVVGNPPYGRVRLSAEQRERFARSLYGHANLYGLFTDVVCVGPSLEASLPPSPDSASLADNTLQPAPIARQRGTARSH